MLHGVLLKLKKNIYIADHSLAGHTSSVYIVLAFDMTISIISAVDYDHLVLMLPAKLYLYICIDGLNEMKTRSFMLHYTL